MSGEPKSDANVANHAGGSDGDKAAAAYFGQPAFARILEAARDTYIRLGYVGGTARIEAPTPAEETALRDFFGRKPRRDERDRLIVELAAWDRALQQSRFACRLLDLLVARYDRLPTTQPERRAQAEAAWTAFCKRVENVLPDGPARTWWTRISHDQGGRPDGSAAIIRLAFRVDNPVAAREAEQAARLVGAALADLPCARGAVEPLPLFAARLSGDPHALDSDRLAGRLLEAALAETVAGSEALALDEMTPAERRDTLLGEAGLVRDEFSSTVLVGGLVAVRYTADAVPRRPFFDLFGRRRVRWLHGAGRDGCALALPLRELRRWHAATAHRGHGYIVENPALFAALHERTLRATRKAPALILGGGRPNLAVLRLVDLLVTGGVVLHYAGDFDPVGLEIADRIMQRTAGSGRLWRMSPADFERALAVGGLPLSATERTQLVRLAERASGTLHELAVALLDAGCKAYQESLLAQYLQDWAEVLGVGQRAARQHNAPGLHVRSSSSSVPPDHAEHKRREGHLP